MVLLLLLLKLMMLMMMIECVEELEKGKEEKCFSIVATMKIEMQKGERCDGGEGGWMRNGMKGL